LINYQRDAWIIEKQRAARREEKRKEREKKELDAKLKA